MVDVITRERRLYIGGRAGHGEPRTSSPGVVSRSEVVANSAGQHATWLHVTSRGMPQAVVGRDVLDVMKTWGAVELEDREAGTGADKRRTMLVSQLAGVGTGPGPSEGVENVEDRLVRAGQSREGAPAKHALSRFGAKTNTLGQPQAPTAQCQGLQRPHNSKASRATSGAIRSVFLPGAPWGLSILINLASLLFVHVFGRLGIIKPHSWPPQPPSERLRVH